MAPPPRPTTSAPPPSTSTPSSYSLPGGPDNPLSVSTALARLEAYASKNPSSSGAGKLRLLADEYKATTIKRGNKSYPKGCLGAGVCTNVLCDHKYAAYGSSVVGGKAGDESLVGVGAGKKDDVPPPSDQLITLLQTALLKEDYDIHTPLASSTLLAHANKLLPSLTAIKSVINRREKCLHDTGRINVPSELAKARAYAIATPLNSKGQYKVPHTRDLIIERLEWEDDVLLGKKGREGWKTLMSLMAVGDPDVGFGAKAEAEFKKKFLGERKWREVRAEYWQKLHASKKKRSASEIEELMEKWEEENSALGKCGRAEGGKGSVFRRPVRGLTKEEILDVSAEEEMKHYAGKSPDFIKRGGYLYERAGLPVPPEPPEAWTAEMEEQFNEIAKAEAASAEKAKADTYTRLLENLEETIYNTRRGFIKFVKERVCEFDHKAFVQYQDDFQITRLKALAKDLVKKNDDLRAANRAIKDQKVLDMLDEEVNERPATYAEMTLNYFAALEQMSLGDLLALFNQDEFFEHLEGIGNESFATFVDADDEEFFDIHLAILCERLLEMQDTMNSNDPENFERITLNLKGLEPYKVVRKLQEAATDHYDNLDLYGVTFGYMMLASKLASSISRRLQHLSTSPYQPENETDVRDHYLVQKFMKHELQNIIEEQKVQGRQIAKGYLMNASKIWDADRIDALFILILGDTTRPEYVSLMTPETHELFLEALQMAGRLRTNTDRAVRRASGDQGPDEAEQRFYELMLRVRPEHQATIKTLLDQGSMTMEEIQGYYDKMNRIDMPKEKKKVRFADVESSSAPESKGHVVESAETDFGEEKPGVINTSMGKFSLDPNDFMNDAEGSGSGSNSNSKGKWKMQEGGRYAQYVPANNQSAAVEEATYVPATYQPATVEEADDSEDLEMQEAIQQSLKDMKTRIARDKARDNAGEGSYKTKQKEEPFWLDEPEAGDVDEKEDNASMDDLAGPTTTSEVGEEPESESASTPDVKPEVDAKKIYASWDEMLKTDAERLKELKRVHRNKTHLIYDARPARPEIHDGEGRVDMSTRILHIKLDVNNDAMFLGKVFVDEIPADALQHVKDHAHIKTDAYAEILIRLCAGSAAQAVDFHEKALRQVLLYIEMRGCVDDKYRAPFGPHKAEAELMRWGTRLLDLRINQQGPPLIRAIWETKRQAEDRNRKRNTTIANDGYDKPKGATVVTAPEVPRVEKVQSAKSKKIAAKRAKGRN